MHLTPRQLETLNFIKKYKARRGYSPTLEEIATELGVSKVTVFEHISLLEKKGAVKRTKHATRSVEPIEESPITPLTRLPLVGYIAAGRPIEAVEVPETIDVPSMLSREKECFVLRVKGDSMIGEQISDGDYVIVEKREWARDGETVVALLEGNEATLKKFYKETDRIRLQPANPTMQPIYANDVRVQGVVIGVLRKY